MYSIREELEERGRLETALMYSIKRRGPKIEPVGSPRKPFWELRRCHLKLRTESG